MATPRRPRRGSGKPSRLQSQTCPDQFQISFQIPSGSPTSNLRARVARVFSGHCALSAPFGCLQSPIAALASTSHRLVGTYRTNDATTASAAPRGPLLCGGGPILPGAPVQPPPLTRPPPECVRILLLLLTGAAALFVPHRDALAPAPSRAARCHGGYCAGLGRLVEVHGAGGAGREGGVRDRAEEQVGISTRS